MRTKTAHRFLLATAIAAIAVGGSLPAAAAPAATADGFIYGKVMTRGGTTYEGRLRWDDEEAAWGDYFNSSKDDNPWVDMAPRRERSRRGRTISIFGYEVRVDRGDWFFHESRQFVARFGDIQSLEPRGGDRVVVTMKNGTRHELDGGSNDVEAKIWVWDKGLGKVGVEWRRIDRIELMAAPGGLQVNEPRLHGTVETRSGSFTGFVQWDQQECMGEDVLDGETDDGDVDVRLATIESIERRSRRSSTVRLTDGRELVLSGTNDVDSSNRGIFVEDPRFGRVLIGWDAFERLDVTDAGSGPSYADYPPGEPLRGTVVTVDGKTLRGRLVYDLDEAETTELLDGKREDIDYSIPLSLVASVTPRGDRARVTLRSGEELTLEDTADVGDGNAGMLVFASEKGDPTYVAWEDVERVDFDAPAKSWPPSTRLPAERAP